MDQGMHGPAETILQSLLTHTDHLYHNRPGMITEDGRTRIGVRWQPVTHKVENEEKVVYRLEKVGNKQTRIRVGVMQDDLSIVENGVVKGHYRPAGIFPEVAAWMYNQVAEVWKMDNEFAAKWASYAFKQEHRDLKVVLAAFMLCQARKGDPERDGGEIVFYDDDYRSVGEAMLLLKADGRDFNPKMLMRVRDVLLQDGVAKINRDLGFGKSLRRPFLGRWPKGVEKWLRYRELNQRVLEGLVKGGFRSRVIELAQSIGYKPTSDKFFEILRWKQKQSSDGRRTLALDMKVKEAESWEGLTEAKICKKIVKEKPSYKVITSKVPAEIGVTRAIMAAAIEAEALSDKDLIIATPTLEELGLLQVQGVRERWQAAVKAAEDQRAANIARNVRNQDTKEQLQEAADVALQKAVEKAVEDVRIYLAVDISASMHTAIDEAKVLLEKFVQGFPVDRLHIALFNTVAREITLKAPSAAGVRAAFRGKQASGGTSHAAALRVFQKHPPQDGEDVIILWVGDEEEQGHFADAVERSGLRPAAFGFLQVRQARGASRMVRNTADRLGIPCFMIDQATFDDPYSIPRTISALVASTPVGVHQAAVQRAPRVTLVEQILQTDLLQKPAWAA